MSRQTIDFGIDLGTTNSEIAVLRGTDIEVFKNNENFENTPSAVWIDKKGALQVGRCAKERLMDDPDNAYCEFKLQMGNGAEYTFQRTGRKMKPEDLSAEVLKSLKRDVTQMTGEEVNAAVITVPAAFEARQCDATNKAARLAGLTISPLVQEPVAAALAYGFQNDKDNTFWLVYDLGGGTFDAAIIQIKDGMIQVINHQGDNHLGGKLIDWAIVEDLFIPEICKEHPLTDFNRGNVKWRAAIAKLKQQAEIAKIRLSREEATEVRIEYLCQDDRGEPVGFEYELSRKDFQKLTDPFIRRSINICRKALSEKRLGSGNIEKVLLVGGPTLMPYLREVLADPKEGLGIPLEFRVDPITVVARGAAIFAGTQRLETVVNKPVKKDEYAIQIEYQPIGPDVEPLVGGKILSSDDNGLSGFTIEFVNTTAKPIWKSGKIMLGHDGAFMGTLLGERDHVNIFRIELCDPNGNICRATPDTFTITIKPTIQDQPLIHSIGVAMANNEVDRVFEKGEPLPTRKRTFHKTAQFVQKGQEGSIIRIPVVEGENISRADRNKLMGMLEITAHNLKRDIPAGSDVEITIDIDQSRLIRVKAFIPILDEEFEEEIRFDQGSPDPVKLEKEVKSEKQRLEEVRKKARAVQDLKALQLLGQIEEENMEHELESALSASRVEQDAADKCRNRLLDLKSAIDQAEDALEWPALMAEAEESIRDAKEIIQKYGNSSDKQKMSTLEQETRQAKETRDPDLLRRKIREVDSHRYSVLREQPGWWVAYFDYMVEKKETMRDKSQADQLIAQGRRAIDGNDITVLKAVVRQLISLLPMDKQQEAVGYGGTTMKY